MQLAGVKYIYATLSSAGGERLEILKKKSRQFLSMGTKANFWATAPILGSG